MSLQEIYNHLFHGSPLESLRQALFIHERYGDRLREERMIRFLIEKLFGQTKNLSDLMLEMDMGGICSGCASREGGGCCSIYMAGECDTLQILMNLLAGIDVNVMRNNGKDCHFLGSDGCIFLFKPMFCLNYNCSHISQAAGGEKMRRLEQKSGIQLSTQYEVEQQLLDFLRCESEILINIMAFCEEKECR